MSLALWHWHIEISSKCTLKCPRCPRQEVPDTLVSTELKLDFFKQNFPKEFILKNVEKLTFCGDDGDPIYAHDFIEVIQYFKSIKPSIAIIIVTNGSYKNEDWWTQLAKLLDEQDQIHFSIDGWDHESNSIYRINSNWSSIIAGVMALTDNSKCYTVWDAIGFKFNEDKIEDMKSYAKELGFVETLMGRRRWLRDINSSNFTVRGFAERNAINSPIQGSAADMIKLAMIKIHAEMKKTKWESKMILQVHDELVFDAVEKELPKLKELILKCMKEAMVLPNGVPVEAEVGVGKNWLEAH